MAIVVQCKEGKGKFSEKTNKRGNCNVRGIAPYILFLIKAMEN